ncbi:MAG TPA: DUF481 domain-containing protein [Gemmatimonadaceae bacterium]
MRLAIVAAAALVLHDTAGAQDVIWNRTVEASANLLFGAATGRVASLTAGVARADSGLDLRAEMRFSYADAEDAEGVSSVTARSSKVLLGIDHHPFARFSPFAFGSAEANLQQRIAHRYSLGGGAKLRLVPPGDNEASISLALLWEETRTLRPEPGVDPSIALARWSLRFRANRRLNGVLQVTHTTLFQPVADELSRYTAETTTGLAVTLNASLALTVTLQDRYDSEARGRGASSNHDGQLLFGVRAKF